MKPQSDVRASELGMRILLLVQEKHRTDAEFLMADVVDVAIEHFGVSRASAFRHISRAVDVLCIPYECTPKRILRRRERMAEGIGNAKACRWPNGKPGGRDRAL